jgi:hypothetical protein
MLAASEEKYFLEIGKVTSLLRLYIRQGYFSFASLYNDTSCAREYWSFVQFINKTDGDVM